MSENKTDIATDVQSDYYGRDENGDMWLNVSEVRRNNGFEVGPIEPHGPSEQTFSTTDVLFTRGSPCVQFVLTEDGHNALAKLEPIK